MRSFPRHARLIFNVKYLYVKRSEDIFVVVHYVGSFRFSNNINTVQSSGCHAKPSDLLNNLKRGILGIDVFDIFGVSDVVKRSVL